ncbi:uncharacterized, partial [Tachysurus ichikawai]
WRAGFVPTCASAELTGLARCTTERERQRHTVTVGEERTGHEPECDRVVA